MIDEYIRRVEAEEAIEEYCCRRCKDYSEVDGGCISHAQHCEHLSGEEILKPVKSADVQPVKHGRWIETHISLCKWIPEDEKEEGHSFYMAELKCSCCERYNVVTFALTLNKPDFCQLCGARMDGDSE